MIVAFTPEQRAAMTSRTASCSCGQRQAKVTFSVYEERMHSWSSMPQDIEHMA